MLVRVRAETLEVYRGTAQLLTLPRLLGPRPAPDRLPARHLVAGAQAGRVRATTATATTCSRPWPSAAPTTRCVAGRPTRADREYVRLLHLAASTSESEVEPALELLLEQRAGCRRFDAVRELVRQRPAGRGAGRSPAVLDLGVYDRLLAGRGARMPDLRHAELLAHAARAEPAGDGRRGWPTWRCRRPRPT